MAAKWFPEGVRFRLPPFRKERRRMGHPSFVCDLGIAGEWVGHLPPTLSY